MHITDFRLTFIWFQPLLDVLTGALPADRLRRPAAVEREAYIAWFDAVNRERSGSSTPAPPWPPHGGQGFWARYLDTDPSFSRVTGPVAWRAGVPVRIPAPLPLEAGFADARVYTEGLVHPWGLSLLVNVVSSRRWSDVRQLAGHVVDWRHEPWFVLGNRPCVVETAAGRCLDTLRHETFGPVEAASPPGDPFSVFTPVRGSGSRAELDPISEDVHRLLQAGATFSPTWDWDSLVALDQARVAGRRYQPPPHIVFGTSRGRAVWGPAYLAQSTGKHTLSCQHRNLVFASALTQGLAGFAAATVDLGVARMQGDHDALARRAMEALGGMYLGSRYRSGSVKAQLDASGHLASVNALRGHLGLEELQHSTPVEDRA